MIAKHFRWAFTILALIWPLGGQAWGQAAPAPRQFGLIEIGGSGVKASVVEFSAPLPGGEASAIDLKFVRRYPIQNVDPAFKENVPKVAMVIDGLVTDLRARYRLEPLQIYIIAASGLNAGQAGSALRVAVDGIVAGRAGAMTFVSVQEQAQFGFNGVVNCARLAHRRQQTVFIDVGSSEIVAAAAGTRSGACGTEHIAALNFGFGVKTAQRAANGHAPSPGQGAGASAIDERIALALREGAQRALRRPRVYFGGGIVWTIATMLHPEQGASYVRLDQADFARMRAQLEADPLCLTDPAMALRADPECKFVDVNFSAVQAVDQRLRAATDHREIVTSIFTREQLIAGTDILLSLVTQLNLENSEFFFARPALNAWIIGFLLAQESGPQQGEGQAGLAGQNN